MKTKHRYLYVYIVIFVLFAGVIKVNAISSGFLVTDISQEEQDLFMSNINISLLTKEPIKRGVKCFAVSHDGKIAVCPNSTYADEVCVYSRDRKSVV